MLKHTTLRNMKVATKLGEIKFDSEGISHDLTEEQQKTFGNLRGFTFVADTPTKDDKKEAQELKELHDQTVKAQKEKDEEIAEANAKEQEDHLEEAKAERKKVADEHKEEEAEKATPKKKAPRKKTAKKTTDK